MMGAKYLIIGLFFIFSRSVIANNCDNCSVSILSESFFQQQLKDKSLDEKIGHLLKIKIYEDGPNCWNTALFLAGIYPYITEIETSYTTSAFEQHCQEVKEDNLKKGDLARIFWSSGGHTEEIHAFTYVSDNNFFQKMSNGKFDQYGFYTLEETLDTYMRNDYSLKYYRCNRLNEDEIQNEQIHSILKHLEFINLNDLSKSQKEEVVLKVLES